MPRLFPFELIAHDYTGKVELKAKSKRIDDRIDAAIVYLVDQGLVSFDRSLTGVKKVRYISNSDHEFYRTDPNTPFKHRGKHVTLEFNLHSWHIDILHVAFLEEPITMWNYFYNATQGGNIPSATALKYCPPSARDRSVNRCLTEALIVCVIIPFLILLLDYFYFTFKKVN